MTIDLVDEQRPQRVETQFELAARRLTDGWLRAGRFRVSGEDFRLARAFLERTGLNVTELPGLLVLLRTSRGRAEQTTREGAVMVALRRLAERSTASHPGNLAPPHLRLVPRRPRPGGPAASRAGRGEPDDSTPRFSRLGAG